MNVSTFLRPKSTVAYLYQDFTVRQALEKMRFHGYSAIPVLSRDGKYVSSVSEGDFLWFLLDEKKGDIEKETLHNVENVQLSEILTTDRNPPLRITAPMEQIMHRAASQNFIPVIDDLGSFIGIITRRDIIMHRLVNGE